MLHLKSLTLVKLGGSVITQKKFSPPTVDEMAINRIAKEIQAHKGPLIVVLGGGAHGHQAAHTYGFGDSSTPPEKLLAGIPSIRHNMTLLSLEVEQALNANGIPSVVIPPFSSVSMHDGVISSFPTDIIKGALEARCAVIIHGDVCLDDIQGASILSGDTISVYLAKALDIQRVFIGTDVDGIFEEDPRINPNATLVSVIDSSNKDSVLAGAGTSAAIDVTGGMTQKTQELLELANQTTQVAIFNLMVPGRLTSLLEGKSTICTRIEF